MCSLHGRLGAPLLDVLDIAARGVLFSLVDLVRADDGDRPTRQCRCPARAEAALGQGDARGIVRGRHGRRFSGRSRRARAPASDGVEYRGGDEDETVHELWRRATRADARGSHARSDEARGGERGTGTHDDDGIRDARDDVELGLEGEREVGEDAAEEVDEHEGDGDADHGAVLVDLVVLWAARPRRERRKARQGKAERRPPRAGDVHEGEGDHDGA